MQMSHQQLKGLLKICDITPADKYPQVVIPSKAGTQKDTSSLWLTATYCLEPYPSYPNPPNFQPFMTPVAHCHSGFRPSNASLDLQRLKIDHHPP
jgi:hypothetical protein